MIFNNKDIYNMKLHETIEIGEYPTIHITKVASGWLYRFNQETERVFVPFEFYG